MRLCYDLFCSVHRHSRLRAVHGLGVILFETITFSFVYALFFLKFKIYTESLIFDNNNDYF
jgi:hypothetical protein